MKKKAFWLVPMLLAAYAVLFVDIIPMPARHIAFSLNSVGVNTEGLRQYHVAITNISGVPILCTTSMRKTVWPHVLYLRRGIWEEAVEERRLAGGTGVMYPNDYGIGAVAVPSDAEAMRIGMHLTSLSWKGRLGWQILEIRKRGTLISNSLVSWDTKHRSRTEWSIDYQLRDVTNRSPNATQGDTNQ